MTIPFALFPQTKVPHVGVEITRGQSSTSLAVMPHKVLLIGQRLSSGTVAALTPTRVFTEEQAATYHGSGSPLHLMAKSFLANNTSTELWTVSQAGTGSAAAGTIAVGGPATAAGVIALYVAGQRLAVDVATSDTANTIAAAIVAAIGAVASMPVTAAVNGGTPSQVDITAKATGAVGNAIDVRHSFRTGEGLPAGVTLTITETTGGSTSEPNLASVWAALGEEHYTFFVTHYTGAANLAVMRAELLDRWGPVRQNGAVAWVAIGDDHAGLLATGDANNDEFLHILGVNEPGSAGRGALEPPYQWIAAEAGQCSQALGLDPARPVQTLVLRGITAPSPADRFTFAENDALLKDGISTWTVTPAGEVMIQRAITTYQETSLGVADETFLDVETMYIAIAVRYDWIAYVLNSFPRHKLADSAEGLAPGQPVMTPLLGKAVAVARYRLWARAGWVEDVDGFKANVRCERDDTDRNRLNWLFPINVINGLRVRAALFEFQL